MMEVEDIEGLSTNNMLSLDLCGVKKAVSMPFCHCEDQTCDVKGNLQAFFSDQSVFSLFSFARVPPLNAMR